MPVALVTGASRGLGKQIALALADSRYTVIVNYLSSEKESAEVLGQINSNCYAIRADVRDIRQVRSMAKQIEEKSNRLDVIINNAGITKDKLLLKQTEQEWDEILDVNLKGCFNIMRIMTPVMIKSGGGHIINISSYSGLKGKAGQPAYSASKAALLGLTFTAAREFAGYNIKVNAVAPGYMHTQMGIRAVNAIESAKRDSILNRLSSPGNVAEFILYLIKTGNITGQVFSLDSRII